MEEDSYYPLEVQAVHSLLKFIGKTCKV